jgi:hypothetical protein
MVKKIIFPLIVLLIISCKQRTVEQIDNIVSYKNYISSDSIPFNISDTVSEISLDTFDARFIRNKIKTTKIEGIQKRILLIEYAKSMDAFSRNYEGEDYHGLRVDTINQEKYELYTCGKTIRDNGVISYLVLRRVLNTLNRVPYNELILYNVKNNKLCSVVLISHGEENDKSGFSGPILKTYRIGNVFIPMEMSTDKVSNYSLWKVRSGDEFLLATGLKKQYPEWIKYSVLYIDSIGFIRFSRLVNEDEKNIPDILKP